MLYANFTQNLEALKSSADVINGVLITNLNLSLEAKSILQELLEKLALILKEPYNETLIYKSRNVFSNTDVNYNYFGGNYPLDDNTIRDLGFRILAELKNIPELYRNRSPFLDYNNRLEQLTRLTIEAQSALQNIQELETKLIPIYEDIDNKYKSIFQYSEKVEAQKNNQLLENIQTIYAEVKAKDETITETLNTLKASSKRYTDQLSVLKARINTFEETDENYQLAKKALEDLQEQTRAELGEAINIGTFKEFEAVKKEKDSSANKWFWWAFSTILVILAGAIWITITHQAAIPQVKTLLDLLSFIAYKFSILFPLIGLAVFFVQRFLRESRLAEEYRFKSTCALHFKSYMELVEQICTEEVDKEYREFLISQIKELFTSPTERMYKDSNPNNFKAVQDTLELIFPQLEKLKSLLNLGTKTTD